MQDDVTLRSYNHTYTSTTPPWPIPQDIKKANYYLHMLCPLFKNLQLDPAYYDHSLCVNYVCFGVLLFNFVFLDANVLKVIAGEIANVLLRH
jgi:hypothetical protein